MISFISSPGSPGSPGSVHWEPSSYDTAPSVGGPGTTTVKTTTAFNTYNWPSHTWGSSDQGVKTWPSTTLTPAVNKNFNNNNNNNKIISWQKNSWTTTERTTTPRPGEYWATSAPKRELTSKSVLATPSDPTKPLGETATFSSNPWPSQFSSDLLGNVGHTHQVKKTREQDTVPVPIKKRDEILQKNYFFTPSPTPLHLRNGINKIPNFESEFTAFGSEAHKSTFSSFDTNFDAPPFGGSGGARLKKEVKSSDVSEAGEKTFYHYGQPDSSARASVDPAATVLREDERQDLVQLYIPDPLAPGHPQGNGNHGWAPIEEWAEAQMRENLDSAPSWADSQIPPANSITGGDWSDKTKPSPGKTIKKVKTVKKWTSPTPASFHAGTPSPPSYRSRSTTLTPDTVTVSQAELSTMRYPVTPLYNTNFGDYASLDVAHVAGPTGAPGLALFNTVGPRQPHSNSHYMEQNPFIVSPVTPLSVTAATAAAIRRNIQPDEYWNYNPVTEANSVKTYSPLPRSQAQVD